MVKSMKIVPRLGISFITAVLLGALISALSPVGAFLPGWLAAGVLCWLAVFCLLSAWQWAGGGRLLFAMIATAFLLRLGLGIGASLLLPEHGFDEPTQNAGYLFYDAFKRDVESFDLTKTNVSFWDTFEIEFDNDQYGGLLVLSALVYKRLSPDAHRTFLILILAAFTGALGVPFIRRGAALRWNDRVANLVAWILVFYPDSVLYGSSQMREPFLIAFSCIGIWALVYWRYSWKTSTGALLLSALGLFLFSSRVAVVVLGILAVWFWLDNISPRSRPLRLLGYLGIGVAGLALAYLSWEWLHSSAWYDLRMTELNSGRVQYELKSIPDALRTPFLVGYGLAQPVLPAILTYPTLAIWKVIGIARALGWYMLAPLLLYSMIRVWKVQPAEERRILTWFTLATVVWLVVSSARGGGDQWDNPRYRTLLLPWMALLVARMVEWARLRRDAWLPRLVLVELIFVGFFTSWYISRYLQWWGRMSIKKMAVWILLLSALVFASGWILDLWRKWRSRSTGGNNQHLPG